jgi:uncharacterized protein (TIGR02453 family)
MNPRAEPGHFGPEAFRFLRGLARHNTRTWFEAHRGDYERAVRAPMRALIETMDVRFTRTAPEIIGDPRRSMFRIHRDIRFSRDKSPYKTHAACWFYHRDADRQVGRESEGGSAGFYFHLEPGACFLGAGIWMPPRHQLQRIRNAVAEDPEGFAAAAATPGLRRRFGGLSEEAMLTRMPRGYAEDHPAAPWLRYQSFTLGRALHDDEVRSSRLAARLHGDYTRLLPLVRWLNRALGLLPADRR